MLKKLVSQPNNMYVDSYTLRSKLPIIVGIFVVVVVIAFLTYFLTTQSNTAIGGIPIHQTTTTVAPAISPPTIIQVYVNDTGFTPKLLVANTGRRIAINLHNTGTKLHDLYVPSISVNSTLVLPGSNKTTVFYAPSTAGNLTFYSNVDGDQSAGLSGTITVVP